MAKKLSVVQLKQQANVLKSLEVVEQAAAQLYPDFVGCWFSMEFENFPGVFAGALSVQLRSCSGRSTAAKVGFVFSETDP